MSSILKVDQLQDSGGNEIITSNGSGTITVNSQPFKNGITEADQWRLSQNSTAGYNGDLTSGWERADTNGAGYKGTGLTESSGIFSFPITGLYLITYNANYSVDNGEVSVQSSILTTTDNSSYSEVAIARSGNRGTVDHFESSSTSFIFDVENITTHKFKINTASFQSSGYLLGNTGRNETHFTVLRLGDT